MRIVFRADASIDIGTGHVMRCLTLAKALKLEDVECIFVCRLLVGNLVDTIETEGFSVITLPVRDGYELCQREIDHNPYITWLGVSQLCDAEESLNAIAEKEPDWWVVDHYALDFVWEDLVRSGNSQLLAIDDLANRVHQCDVLLDQTFNRGSADYERLVPSDCRLLCGSQYALLREEFTRYREISLTRRQTPIEISNILINLGGVDKNNDTSQVLTMLSRSELPAGCHLTIVMGSTSPWKEAVQSLAEKMPWPVSVRSNVDNMAELMSQSDLAIGAAGATTWERFCLGLPSILLITADNQKQLAASVAKAGAAQVISLEDMNASSLSLCIQNAQALHTMSLVSRSIIDGLGAKRVKDVLINHDYINIQTAGLLRPMNDADLDMVLAWRNHPTIRKVMYTQHEITREEHVSWFSAKSNDPNSHLLIYENQSSPMGFVNIAISRHSNDAVWGFYLAPDAIKGISMNFGHNVLNYVFEQLGLQALLGEVVTSNERSKKFHLRLGFREERVNEFTDIVKFKLLKAEWLSKCEGKKYA